MRLLLFRIKSEPSVAYKIGAYEKECNCVLQSSLKEEVTFPREFIFIAYAVYN